MKYISKNLKDTVHIAEKFLASISKRPITQKEAAALVLLSGNLGAGKTAFVKATAKILGIKEKIVSPTFVLMRKYKIPTPPRPSPLKRGGGAIISTSLEGEMSEGQRGFFTHITHIDAYRLESKKELAALNWDEISKDPKNIIFLEWPEKVFARNPRGAKKISFKFVDEETREIDI